MTPQDEQVLTEQQLKSLASAFHRGAADASSALAKWTGRRSSIIVESVAQLALETATDVLAVADETICFCTAEITGRLTGELILAFDDASGLALADVLMDQPPGTSRQWGEMATSAVLETANILGCAYLNSLARILPEAPQGPSELLPSPPRASRDFAQSLLQFALMGQAVARDQVLLTRTQFQINETPLHLTMLFVPDAESISRLRELIPAAGVDLDGGGQGGHACPRDAV